MITPNYTRRQCLGAAAAAFALRPAWGGAPACDTIVPEQIPDLSNATDWTGSELRVLPRLNASELAVDSPWRNALTMAWSEFRKRPPSDKTSWLAQAALHRWACSGPSDIHHSDSFLLWHRGFVYFHERIFRSIAGDTFRLPCWQWDNTGSSGSPLPSAYTDGDASSNPLFEASRVGNNSGAGGCNDMTSIFEQTRFLGDRQIRGFQPKLGGVHGYIHGAIQGCMGVFMTAALDPIFYAHHVNCDKLIVDWQSLGGGRSWPASLEQQPFYFYDEKRRLVRVLGKQLMDTAKLGYSYGPPVSTACLAPPLDEIDMFGFDGRGGMVQFPKRGISELHRTGAGSITLLINGIRTERSRLRLLWFFANLDGYGDFPLDQSNPGFLGSLGIVPQHHGAPLQLRDQFDVTGPVHDMLRSGRRVLRLTIVEVNSQGRILHREPLHAASYRLQIRTSLNL